MNAGKNAELIHHLRMQQAWLGTVESCTGGLIAQNITQNSGASEVYWGGWITYDDSAKELLGVDALLLKQYGAVSAQVARAMAEAGLTAMKQALGIRAAERPLACLSTTGIAGPTGGTPLTPVGLCYVGLAIEGHTTQSDDILEAVGLTRSEYQRRFAEKSLDLLMGKLESTQ